MEDIEKLAEEMAEKKLGDSPSHIKEMEKNMILAGLMLEISGLKLSHLHHPKRCNRCGGWLRRKYIYSMVGYRYHCPQCGDSFYIPLKRLIEKTLETKNKREVRDGGFS